MQYPQTRYSDTLASAITSSALSLTVTTTAPTRTEGILTIGRTSSNTEDVYYNAVAGTVVTISLRGLSQTALTLTEVAGNKKTHAASEGVEITTHHNYDTNKARKDEDETISGAWTISGIASFTARPRITGGINDSGGNEAIDIDATSSAVNQLRVINAAASGNVIITTAGDDTDIDLELQAKGSGVIIVENGAVMKTSAAPTTDAMISNKKYVDDQILTVSDIKVKVSAADTTTDYLSNKLAFGTHLSGAITTPAGNEDYTISTDAVQSSAGSASANFLMATDSAGHMSNTFTGRTLTAYEAISAGDAVVLLPIEVEFFAQLTDANLALGDSNIRRRHAIKFIPTATTSTLTTMQFRAAEAVNGATTLGDLTISIQLETAGAPSGTAISNGTANAISQVTQRTWNTTQASRTATWASAPTLTAGTTYWLVFECAATDGTNYLNFSVNSAHDENYHTFTRLTYNLDTGSWGTSTTNATPFFWFNTQTYLLGQALAQADASWGARTFNFIGFAPSAIAAQASGEVQHDMATLTGLTPNSVYFLSETAGQITTTAPSGEGLNGNEATAFPFKIGRTFAATTELKIEIGQKRVLFEEIAGLTATTTRQYLTWFKPEFVRIDAKGGTTALESASTGFLKSGGGDSVVFAEDVQTAGAARTPGASGSLSLQVDESGASNGFTGAGSGLSRAGFTYTYTEQGTGVVYAILEAIAS